MAGIATSCLTFSSRSKLQACWLEFGTHHARSILGKPTSRRKFGIRAEVNYVNAEEAKKLVSTQGYVVLDVRDKTQYDRARTIVKRTVHNNFSGLFFGLPFTKPNPEFVDSVKRQFSPESKLLVVCQEGLRSTAAANKLEQAGFQNIACITSGLQSVKPVRKAKALGGAGTFDSEGSAELQDAGKAGLITVQGKISAVLGTVLICAYLFITFFPEQAERLFQLAPAG